MKYQIEIPVFDGGLNTKNNAGSLPPNQSPDLLNVIFDDYGAVGTRRGQVQYLSPIASAPIDGLAPFNRSDNASFLVAVCNGTMWQGGVASYTPVSGSTGLYTVGQDVSLLQYHDFVIATNGYAQVYKWSGNYFTQLGAPVVPNNAVPSINGAGPLTGDYTYVFTGVTSGLAEGDYGQPSASLTVNANSIQLSNIPVWPSSAGVNFVNVYRNTAQAADVYNLVTSVVNGTTSILDSVPDASLVTVAPADNGQMVPCKFICQYGGYVFAAGDPNHPMWLYFSNAGQPEIWSSTDYLQVGQGDGFPITGIEPFGNSIIIHKNDMNGNGSVYILYLPDSTGATGSENWYITKSPSQWSGQSGKALAFFSNMLAFFNKNGVFTMNANSLALGSATDNSGNFQADSHSFDIEPTILNANQTQIYKSAMAMHKNKVWLAYADGTSGQNNKVLQYDFARISNPDRTNGAWALFDQHNINNFCEYQGNLYGGSSLADGKIYQLDVGTNDNGNSINSYYTTAAISGAPEHRDHWKVWRWLYLWIECEGDFNMSLTYILDFGMSPGQVILVNLASGGSNWGEFQWGNNVWGGGLARKKVKIGLFGSESRDIQFQFLINTLNLYWKVHKLMVVYNLRSLR
jgi:hypothetical protein